MKVYYNNFYYFWIYLLKRIFYLHGYTVAAGRNVIDIIFLV